VWKITPEDDKIVPPPCEVVSFFDVCLRQGWYKCSNWEHMSDNHCPECGAPGTACAEQFNECLALEFTDAGFGAVHHLTVAAYLLQHSSRLTRQGWIYERDLLKEFLIENQSPEFVRSRNKDLLESGKRRFNLRSRGGSPVIGRTAWTKTIMDVCTQDAFTYCADVTAWARSTLIDSESVELE
jgi:hypothetical protein